MFGTVDDGFDAGIVRAENCLFTGLEIYPVDSNGSDGARPPKNVIRPLNIPIWSSAERFVLILPPADVQDWRTMFELRDELVASFFVGIVEVDMSVP